MKKIKFLFAFLLAIIIGNFVNAQIITSPNNSFGTRQNRGQFDSTLYYPTGCGAPTDTTSLKSYGFTGTGQKVKMSATYFDSCGHKQYTYDPSTKSWSANTAGPGLTADQVIGNGCQVIWEGNLKYRVLLPCSYYIGNINYNLSASVPVILNTADPTNPRQDAIVANIIPSADKVTGTAQVNPQVPTINAANQLFLTSAFVAAGATTPSGVSQVVVRDSTYSSGDWYMSGTATYDSVYATNPFPGSKGFSVRMTAAADQQYIQFNSRANVLFSKLSYTYLILHIQNNTVFNAARNLQVTVYNGVTQVGANILLSNYQYNKTLTGSYQTLAIPLTAFAGAPDFTSIRITNTGSAGTPDVQFDYTILQGGILIGNRTTSSNQIFFNTVAEMRAYTGSTDAAATTLGYYTANDGGGATYKYNAASTATDDAGLFHKSTSLPGGWELQYGSKIWIKQLGAKSDSTTDTKPFLKLAMAALNIIPLHPLGLINGHGTILINRGKYYFSDSIQVRNTINIVGEGAGTYPFEETQFIFSGIHGGLYFMQTAAGLGARNCSIKNIALKSQLTNYRQIWHGLFSNTTITIDNVSAYNFSGDGIIIDTRDSGNANNSFIRVHADYNRRYGLSLWGNDANNCEIYFDGTANGGSNIHDFSFLGNKYKWVHSSSAGIRQPDNLSYVNVSGVIYGAIQPSINIQPGVTSGWQDYWVQQNNLPLGWTTAWRFDSTYFDAAAIWSGGSANGTTLDAPYTESGQAPTFLGPYSTILNGNNNGAGITGHALQMSNSGNGLLVTSQIKVKDYVNPNTSVYLDDGNGLNISNDPVGIIQMKAFASITDQDSAVRIYRNSSLQPTLSFLLKDLKGHPDFKVDSAYAAMPVFGHRGFWMSDNANPSYTNSNKNLFISGHALPTSAFMVYPTGAFMFYDGASADTIGARCITGGRGGTATWSWILASAGGGGGGITPGYGLIGTTTVRVDTSVNGVTTKNDLKRKIDSLAAAVSGAGAWILTGNTLGADGFKIGALDNHDFTITTNGKRRIYFPVSDGNVIFGDSYANGTYKQIEFQFDGSGGYGTRGLRLHDVFGGGDGVIQMISGTTMYFTDPSGTPIDLAANGIANPATGSSIISSASGVNITTDKFGLAGIGNPSAKFEINSTTQGYLPPRMTTTQKNAISSPAEGLTVYDLTLHKTYTWDGSTWQAHW